MGVVMTTGKTAWASAIYNLAGINVSGDQTSAANGLERARFRADASSSDARDPDKPHRRINAGWLFHPLRSGFGGFLNLCS